MKQQYLGLNISGFHFPKFLNAKYYTRNVQQSVASKVTKLSPVTKIAEPFKHVSAVARGFQFFSFLKLGPLASVIYLMCCRIVANFKGFSYLILYLQTPENSHFAL